MTARFQFMRCGLISLFHYANQVFDAEDGHLLLRGSNGSGKSTAVELVVPLLFDGNLTSSNLSTSDGQRSIVYHLLLDGLYTRRLGYSWAQFALHDEDGGERWVTLALGVKAAQDTRHDAWFAIWDTPVMVDPQVMLVRPDQAPLGRREVAQLPGVELYDSAEDYRARVNALLFGFSARRYEAMLKLMRRLRSAQLGKAINVAQTTELLELALPELDVELLAGVGGKLDELESLRGELSALQEADAAAGRFVDRYRDFARGVVARELGAADDIVRAARREERKERRLAASASRPRRRWPRPSATSPASTSRSRTSRASCARCTPPSAGARSRRSAPPRPAPPTRTSAPAAPRRASPSCATKRPCWRGARRRGRGADRRGACAGRRRRVAARGLRGGRSRRPAAAPAARARRRAAGLRPPHPAHRAARAGRAAGGCASARAEADRQRAALDVAEAAERDLRARRDELELEREEAQERLAEAIDAWAAGLTELRPEPRRGARRSRPARDPPPRRRGGAVLGAPPRAGAVARRARGRAERPPRRLDPPPPVAPWRDADQPGAPLWRLCDFAPGLDERARAGLERALEASGLLDARVDEGGALRSGHLVIEGVPHSTAATLSHSAAPPTRARRRPSRPAPASAGAAGPRGRGLAGGAGPARPPGRAARGRRLRRRARAAGRRAAPAAARRRPGARTLADVLSAPPRCSPPCAPSPSSTKTPAARSPSRSTGRSRSAPCAARAPTPPRASSAPTPARPPASSGSTPSTRARAADREDAQVDDELATLQRRARTLQQERASEPRLEGDAGARHAALGRELETRRAAIDAQREATRAATDQLAEAERAVIAHATAHDLPHAPDPDARGGTGPAHGGLARGALHAALASGCAPNAASATNATSAIAERRERAQAEAAARAPAGRGAGRLRATGSRRARAATATRCSRTPRRWRPSSRSSPATANSSTPTRARTRARWSGSARSATPRPPSSSASSGSRTPARRASPSSMAPASSPSRSATDTSPGRMGRRADHQAQQGPPLTARGHRGGLGERDLPRVRRAAGRARRLARDRGRARRARRRPGDQRGLRRRARPDRQPPPARSTRSCNGSRARSPTRRRSCSRSSSSATSPTSCGRGSRTPTRSRRPRRRRSPPCAPVRASASTCAGSCGPTSTRRSANVIALLRRSDPRALPVAAAQHADGLLPRPPRRGARGGGARDARRAPADDARLPRVVQVPASSRSRTARAAN